MYLTRTPVSKPGHPMVPPACHTPSPVHPVRTRLTRCRDHTPLNDTPFHTSYLLSWPPSSRTGTGHPIISYMFSCLWSVFPMQRSAPGRVTDGPVCLGFRAENPDRRSPAVQGRPRHCPQLRGQCCLLLVLGQGGTQWVLRTC